MRRRAVGGGSGMDGPENGKREEKSVSIKLLILFCVSPPITTGWWMMIWGEFINHCEFSIRINWILFARWNSDWLSSHPLSYLCKLFHRRRSPFRINLRCERYKNDIKNFTKILLWLFINADSKLKHKYVNYDLWTRLFAIDRSRIGEIWRFGSLVACWRNFC